MKEYIKFGIGAYFGWKIAKAVDRFLCDIYKAAFETSENAEGKSV